MEAIDILTKKARNERVLGLCVLLVGLTLGIVGSFPVTDSGYNSNGDNWTSSGPLNPILALIGFLAALIGAAILIYGLWDAKRLGKILK